MHPSTETIQKSAAPQSATSSPPGVVISHSYVKSGQYIGSPSIAKLDDGTYVASHDFFGPETKEHEAATTLIFRSEDAGQSWQQVAEICPAFWSGLFAHEGVLYLFGPTHHHGHMVIRRSDDSGLT